MPRFIYISKIDEDHSDYNATFDALRERFGNKIAPVVVPTLLSLIHISCCPMPKQWWAAAVCGRRCAGQPGCPWRVAPPAFC